MSECWDYLRPTAIATSDTAISFKESWQWLEEFKPVSRIANFGCYAPQVWRGKYLFIRELFALLWMLDATHLDIVEKEVKYANNAKKAVNELRKRNPECITESQINVIQGDMTNCILPSNSYDLAFCESVIRYSCLDGLKAMVDCVRVGGFIAVIDEGIQIHELAAEIDNITLVQDINRNSSRYPNRIYSYQKC